MRTTELYLSLHIYLKRLYALCTDRYNLYAYISYYVGLYYITLALVLRDHEKIFLGKRAILEFSGKI